MQIISEISHEVYLSSLKEQLSSDWDIWSERFTGFVIGRFVYVSHNAGHEFNRRVTNERHTAIGFAMPIEDKTKFFCLRFAGISDPLPFIGMYLICVALFAFCASALHTEFWLLALIPAAFVAIITAISNSVTQRGVESSLRLNDLLTDPTNYY